LSNTILPVFMFFLLIFRAFVVCFVILKLTDFVFFDTDLHRLTLSFTYLDSCFRRNDRYSYTVVKTVVTLKSAPRTVSLS